MNSIDSPFGGLHVHARLFEWESLDTMIFGEVSLHEFSVTKIAVVDGITPESDVTDDFSGVLSFLIFGSFFIDKDGSLGTVESFIPHVSGVHSISGLHSTEETWSCFSSTSKVELVKLVSDLVWSHSSLPFGVGFTVGAPCDP